MSKYLRCLCEHCKSEIQGKLIFEEGRVYYEKLCKNTELCARYKPARTLVSTDSKYYKECLALARKRRRSTANMCVVELTNDCNINCSICIAGSYPGAGKYKSLDKILGLISSIERHQLHPEIVMLSGGEPTIHPDFNKTLEYAYKSTIPHVFLITNGVRIAEEPRFAEFLSNFKDKLEVYLQFDSTKPLTLVKIRGIDLSEIRKKSLENLDRHGVPTTLVSVVKKGANDFELNDIIDHALSYDCVRGVTFQPMKASGRHSAFERDKDSITLSEVRTRIISSSSFFNERNLIPHPVNPVNISIGYLSKSSKGFKPVTESLLRPKNKKKNTLFKKLRNMMFFLPYVNTRRFAYDRLFRVAIVSFMDLYDLNYQFLASCNITTMTESNKMVSLDSYYLSDEKSTSGLTVIP